MSIPIHTLNVYQKPKAGDKIITRYPTLNYRHQIIANGWYDTASCDLVMSRVQAENAFENWIGNRVAVFVDNPAQPIWEGLISRVTYSVGGATFTRSLDEMFNQVRGYYKAPATSAGTFVTTNANETVSQSIYGIKHGTFDGYYEISTTVLMAPRINAIRDSIIGTVAWPQTSVVLNEGKPMMVSIEMKGFYHTLAWEEYYNGANNWITINAFITAVLTALQNGTTFFNNADLTAVATNTTFGNVNQREDAAQPAWEVLQRVAGAGTATTYYIMGITPSDFTTGTRRFYYRSINTAIKYIAYTRDGLRVRNQWGGLVKPWNVVPDCAIRINDVLIGWGGMGDDPRETYIERVQYEAENQRVTWAGGDDLSAEGTMQLQNHYKMCGTPFGTPPLTSWQ